MVYWSSYKYNVASRSVITLNITPHQFTYNRKNIWRKCLYVNFKHTTNSICCQALTRVNTVRKVYNFFDKMIWNKTEHFENFKYFHVHWLAPKMVNNSQLSWIFITCECLSNTYSNDSNVILVEKVNNSLQIEIWLLMDWLDRVLCRIGSILAM